MLFCTWIGQERALSLSHAKGPLLQAAQAYDYTRQPSYSDIP